MSSVLDEKRTGASTYSTSQRGGELRIYIDSLAILTIGGRKWLGESGGSQMEKGRLCLVICQRQIQSGLS